MKQNKNIQPTSELAILDTWVEGQPFQIRGDYEAVAEQLPRADQYIKTLTDNSPVAVVQPAQPVIAPKPAYEDFNTLEAREVLRRKISAWVWDRKNGTNMLDLLNQRIAEDRNLAMAQRLGLISSVHCARHQKAVDKLKRIV